MKPRPSDPSVPPLAEPVHEEAGETSHGPRTTVGKSASDVMGAPAREPQVGEFVGPYPILGELGRGGMAIVFRSKDPSLAREIALKVMLPRTSEADPTAKARFAREADAQAKVDHPHVVAIYQAGEWNGVPYFAMPSLKGQTLAALLKESRANETPLPAAEVVRIGREIAEGLEAAHTAGLVHRDIKPGNIWLEEPRRWVKLLDFGLAREEAVTPTGSDEPVTKMGVVVGTPSYMSPEQARGEAVDARTDLWSLGVVLYQMATNEKPFNGKTPYNVLVSVIEDDPPPLDDADIPPKLVALIMRLLSKDPDDRPRTATAVVAALAAIEKALHAPPVIQLPVDGTAPPTVWGDLDTTEQTSPPAARTVREPRPAPKAERNRTKEREAPRSRSAQRDDAQRSLLWAWVASGAILVVVILGALIWFAVQSTRPAKPKDETVTPKPPEPKKGGDKKVEPAPDPDRTAATLLRDKAILKILPEGGAPTVVKLGEALPAGKFALTEIDFGEQNLHATYAADTFLPAVARLKSLTRVSMIRGQLALSTDQVAALAKMPLSDTLEQLEADTEFTPKSLTELKKFGRLNDLTGHFPAPDDAVFARLGDLSLKFLVIVDLKGSEGVTDKGWEALGKLPLDQLLFFNCRLTPEAFRALTATGGQTSLAVGGGTLGDAHLLELSRQPSDLRALVLRQLNGVTDAGLLHLAKVTSLEKLELNLSAITDEGVEALKRENPKLKVLRKVPKQPG